MTTITRLTDSCLLVDVDGFVTMFDPGFHAWQSGEIELDRLGDVHRILITHEHGDHVSPDFVTWVLDRGDAIAVHSNAAVAALLAPHDIEVSTEVPDGVTAEDVRHEVIPNGTAPPNRAFTIGDILTHPGDSYAPTTTAPVLALPLMAPWGSTTASMAFAKRLAPRQVIPIHDWYLAPQGRAFLYGMAGRVLADAGIELIPLDWGQTITL